MIGICNNKLYMLDSIFVKKNSLIYLDGYLVKLLWIAGSDT